MRPIPADDVHWQLNVPQLSLPQRMRCKLHTTSSPGVLGSLPAQVLDGFARVTIEGGNGGLEAADRRVITAAPAQVWWDTS
jgi:hypothetical protein